jgi:sterol desaturase/sphingolipid hydroxylase (fatty acid hydroxylase superfamily)
MHAREFLTTVAIVLAIMAVIAVVELIQPLFSHPARHKGRSTTNLSLTALTLTLNWVLTSAAAVLALALPLQGPGIMQRLEIPFAVQVVASIVVLDFSFGYLSHLALHKVPILWRVHRVHHCDPFVDGTTTYRNHPLEGAWRFLSVIVPVWVVGLPAEAVVIHRLLSAINGILEHANIRLWQPLDRLLSLLWVTPQMHKIHHSRAADETDSNYGNILSIHDRILHTFTPTERAFTVRYGLDDIDPRRATSLPALLAMPFQVDGSVAAHPASLFHDTGTFHTSPAEAAEEAAQAQVHALVLTHFIPPVPMGALEGPFLGDARQRFSGPLLIARDGDLLSLPAAGGALSTSNLLD